MPTKMDYAVNRMFGSKKVAKRKSKRKPSIKRVKYFIRGEKKAIKEYHVYDSDKGVKEIEHDEKHHKKFWEKRLKKLKKVA